MTRRISDREWQELSAYLDGQLPTKETVRLEQKLQQRAELRAAYQDLRRVRHLLRSQPRLRAPRNFTLSAETVGITSIRRPAPRRLPVFGLVSALASLMLVLVIVGEFLVGSPRTTVQPVAMEAQHNATVTEALPLLQAEDETSSKVVPVQATPRVGLRAYPAPESGESIVAAPQALESPPMEYPPPEQPVEGDQQGEALSMAVEEGASVEQDVSQDQPSGPPLFWNGWRIAELVLLVTALTSAAAAIILRQKGSR
jgi:anti-sigma factor RsiW